MDRVLMEPPVQPQGLRGAYAAQVFLSFAFAYLLSYALRAVNAVLAPALTQELHLSHSAMGLLSAFYFLSFGAMQLPLGIYLDRYGPRKIEAALLLIAALGCAIFAGSQSLIGLCIGRFLIGIGVSACLMAAFKAYRLWFQAKQQSQLASWMLVAGTSGALLASMPVNAALPLLGWRGIFWIFAGLLTISSCSIYFLLKPAEQQFPVISNSSSASQQGYRSIFADPYFRRLGMLGLAVQGIFVAFQTLWAASWMSEVLQLTTSHTAEILFILNLTLLIGYLALGWWAPRRIAAPNQPGWPVPQVLKVSLAGMLVFQTAILFCQADAAWLLWLPMAIMYTAMTLVQTHLSLTFPAELAGRVNTAYNLLMFIGIFVTQWGVGIAIDAFKLLGMNQSQALRASFAACIALQILVLWGFSRKTAASKEFH